MAERPLCILTVSKAAVAGGAEKVAWGLHRAFRGRGCRSFLVAGHKVSDEEDVFVLPNDMCRSRWARFWIRAGDVLKPLVGTVRGAGRARELIHQLGQLQRLWNTRRGYEDFEFPGTVRLLQLVPERPDIVHCHNLHGGYFDLRVLPYLSRQVPLVLTLHDAWLLSGHCAHSLDCDRWRTGCGSCPDLSLYPAIRRDATAFNWRRKREILASSQCHVAAPSRWLMEKVKRSMFMDGVLTYRVIPNGVDLSIFRPRDKRGARLALGMDPDSRMVLFASRKIMANPWRDYDCMRSAIAGAARRLGGDGLCFIVLGEGRPAERADSVEIRFVPYQRGPEVVASYYQAADVYIHASKADTFPNAVIEALACGTPVVATATGGISEQIKDGVTGYLTPPGDAEAMADRLCHLLEEPDLRRRMTEQAAGDARHRFDLNRMVGDYLDLYSEAIEAHDSESGEGLPASSSTGFHRAV